MAVTLRDEDLSPFERSQPRIRLQVPPRVLCLGEQSVTPRDPLATLESDFPWVDIFIRRLPDVYGQTVWSGAKPHIELAADLGPIVQRVTLAHELQHLVAGRPCTSFCGDNERDVVDATARWLLPDVIEIGAALAGRTLREAATALLVTTDVLLQRLSSMSDTEHAELHLILPGGTDRPPGSVRAAYGPRRIVETRRGHSCEELREPDAPIPLAGSDKAPDPSGSTRRNTQSYGRPA